MTAQISFSRQPAAYPLDNNGEHQWLREFRPMLRATYRLLEVFALFQLPKLRSGTGRIPATVQPVSVSSARDRGLLKNGVVSSPQLNPDGGDFK